MAGDVNSSLVKRVVFAGRVQGVGFRVTTREIAGKYPVTGYVRNQSDGTVEVIVRGSEEDIRQFIDAVTRRFQSNISSVTETRSIIDQPFEAFEIERT